MARVACIGECMIELRQAPGGLYSRGFGGDTLNTAVYLARLGIATDYITALGDDSLSDEMIAGWQAEGIGTAKVARLKGRLPGVYMIDTDDRGERRFFHWRESAARTRNHELAGNRRQSCNRSPTTRWSIFPRSRSRFFDLRRAVETVWRSAACARSRARASLSIPIFAPAAGPHGRSERRSRMALQSPTSCWHRPEDLLPVYPDKTDEQLLQRIPSEEAILKLLDPGSIVRLEGRLRRIDAEPLTGPVVDTTAAGDSFAAAYLAARLDGADPVAAARAGHDLAGVVVCYPGAIIPPLGDAGRRPISRKAST